MHQVFCFRIFALFVATLLSINAAAGLSARAETPLSTATSQPIDFSKQKEFGVSIPDGGEMDSDGDGIPDSRDRHPLIAERMLSWEVSGVTIGWSLNRSISLEEIELTSEEAETLKEEKLTWGGDTSTSKGASFEAEAGASGQLSFNPFMISGEARVSAGLRAGVSTKTNTSLSRQSVTAGKISNIRKTLSKRAHNDLLTDQHIEFTVNFTNATDYEFVAESLWVPIMSGNQTLADAVPYIGREREARFVIPANRGGSFPIRFRAKVDTTQALQGIIDAMESGKLEIDLTKSTGSIRGQVSRDLVDIFKSEKEIRDKTYQFSLKNQEQEISWNIARKNPAADKQTTLYDAAIAINQYFRSYLGADREVFSFENEFLRSAAGIDCGVLSDYWWTIRSVSNRTTRNFNIYEVLWSDTVVELERTWPRDMTMFVQRLEKATPWQKLIAGRLYLFDAGKYEVSPYYSKGIQLITSVAKRGDAQAQAMLGVAYFNGRGVEKNEKESVRWFRKAAEQGFARAQDQLGLAYFNGQGVEKNEKEGVRWSRKAAEQGEALAQAQLGVGHARIFL